MPLFYKSQEIFFLFNLNRYVFISISFFNFTEFSDENVGRAVEGTRFQSPDAISQHLSTLINQSKDQVEKFGQLIKSTTIVGSQLTPAHLKECEKQRNLWQKRLNGLKKLKLGLETSGRPHGPAKVIVEVTGELNFLNRDNFKISV